MLSTTDRHDITDTYARYVFAFDHGDPTAWAECFIEAGSFDIDATRELHGRAELAAFVREVYRPPGMRHLMSNLLLCPTPYGATGRAYVQVLRLDRNGSLRLANIGEYDDELVRDDGAWRFRRRTFRSWLPTPLANGTLLGSDLLVPAEGR